MLNKYQVEIKYIFITLTLLVSLVVLNQLQVFSGLNMLIDDFFEVMVGFGFLGFLLIALIGNSTLLVILPYTVPLLSLALSGANLDYLLLMSVGSGIGAGLGEIVSYGMALKILGSNPGLEQSNLFQWVKRTLESHPRTAPLLVFIWAVSFLPDDTVIIPMAMVRYSLTRVVLPLFSGKIVHNLVTATIFYYFTDWSADRVSSNVQVDLALGVLILFVMLILYQVEKARTVRLLSLNSVSVPQP